MRRNALPLEKQSKQQMLGADKVVPHPPRFLERDLNDFLDARRRDDLLDDDPLVPTEHGRDYPADLAGIQSKVSQGLRGNPIAFAQEAQEDVLSADVGVVRALRLLLGESEYVFGALGEPLERIDGNPRRQA